ncbi:hypothetical protein [Algoriphagus sp. AK58]|uniref:hypothetical protein n=1 Tax=Algoriphagus sp. AK58 TaxID=1406877 RepID=UPI00165035DF|nr:hypothetical protein [Algoriphagus sp. AK58]MBC6365380.1 hypothetical protein [Algoriphagus sp. AK58]
MKRFLVIGISLVIWGCKTSGGVSGGDASSFSNYQEDLSGSLPEYPDFRNANQDSEDDAISSSQAVDGQLNELQKRIYDKNKSEPFFSGFTVLVYSGIDRNEAFKTRDDLVLYFPEITPEMQYQQPRYLVKVGQYTYKIEAQRAFSRIKTQFPTARIVQDRFQRKEYVPPVTTDQNAQGQN